MKAIAGDRERDRAAPGQAGGIDLADVPEALRQPVAAALAAAGVADGHLALELVEAERIRQLNREHRGRDAPTDVLAFPIDGPGPSAGPRELGDVVICAALCSNLTEAAVHGVLHLCGLDHEADAGEMLALQEKILRAVEPPPPPPPPPPPGPGPGARARDFTLR